MHLLTALGHRAQAGGNIGHPPWDPGSGEEGADGPEPDYWIVETSSFQVPDLTRGPHVVAVTSLAPDHLDWHGTVQRYYEDKLSLCTKPGVTLALADGSDAELRAQAALLGPHLRWVGAAEVAHDTAWSGSLGLPGPHNARNAAIARAVLTALGIEEAADDERLAEAASGFGGLPSRCHSLGQIGSVEFVDDSLSTNVLPAQAALHAYETRPVALLVGGHDRGVDYAPLGTTLADPHATDVGGHDARQRTADRRRGARGRRRRRRGRRRIGPRACRRDRVHVGRVERRRGWWCRAALARRTELRTFHGLSCARRRVRRRCRALRTTALMGIYHLAR